MPISGSTVPYAESRQRTKQMKQQVKASGEFPRVGKSSVDVMHDQLEKINKGRAISSVQQMRVAMDARQAYELDTERMMADLRRARMPAFRGEGARMMGVDRVAEQIY